MLGSPTSADPPAETRSAPPFWIAHRRLLLWTLILLLIAGYIWWRQPRSYHPVARFTAHDLTLLPSTGGFLLREASNRFVLRDWRRGDIRWQVTTASPLLGSRPNLMRMRGFSYSLSPSGEYFAAAAATARGARVQVWRSGAPVTDTEVTAGEPHYPRVKALDTGRVFVWFLHAKACPVTVMDGNTVVARGVFPPDSALAPDGASVLSRQGSASTLAALTINAGNIILSTPRAIHDPIPLLADLYLDSGYDALFAEGTVLTERGAIYRPSGQASGPTAWRSDTIAPGGRYTLQSTGQRGRVYSPVTGDRWAFRIPGHANSGDATQDGRYALAYFSRRLPAPLPQLLRRFTPLEPSFDYVALYERPGKLRAAMRMDVPRWWKGRGEPEEWSWFPSPDGRALVLNIGGAGRNQCVLFRW
ncbi:MAG: hypothetical protein ACYC7E_13785 [Armatimonadota bacterium]